MDAETALNSARREVKMSHITDLYSFKSKKDRSLADWFILHAKFHKIEAAANSLKHGTPNLPILIPRGHAVMGPQTCQCLKCISLSMSLRAWTWSHNFKRAGNGCVWIFAHIYLYSVINWSLETIFGVHDFKLRIPKSVEGWFPDTSLFYKNIFYESIQAEICEMLI